MATTAVLLGQSIMKASDELSSLRCSSGIVGRLLTGSLAGVFETGDVLLRVTIADGVGLADGFAGADGFATANGFEAGDCFAVGDWFVGVGGLSSPLVIWVADSVSSFALCFIGTAAGTGWDLGKTVSLK